MKKAISLLLPFYFLLFTFAFLKSSYEFIENGDSGS
jgi:hypothetical protein